MSGDDPIGELEQLAEASYAAMYDVSPQGVKDHYDDARGYLVRAIEAAQLADCVATATRIAERLKHIEAVYNNQFRGVGR